LSVVTIGGSTTECFYQSDDKTWPALLEQHLNKRFDKVWLNNAGLDGQSTFGHSTLIKNHLIKVKPKVVIFLLGANDGGRTEPNDFDRKALPSEYKVNLVKSFIKEYSLVANFFINVRKAHLTKKQGLAHNKSLDVKSLGLQEITQDTFLQRIQEVNESTALSGYAKRIRDLIILCRDKGMEPIFLSQSKLWGKGVDPVTGVDLERIKLGENSNGKLDWAVQQLYNNELKTVCNENSTLFVDLGEQMPKGSQYYYDGLHFNNRGVVG